MDAALKLQKMIIQKAQPLSAEIEKAFLKYPRHRFVPEYSVTEAYSDHPLLLYENEPFTSTISQPSFVLQILQKLQIEKRSQGLRAWNGEWMECCLDV